MKGFGETYSTKEIPPFWLYEKALNARGKSYLDELDGEGTNWGEFRQAQGLVKQTRRFILFDKNVKRWHLTKFKKKTGDIFVLMGHNDNEVTKK